MFARFTEDNSQPDLNGLMSLSSQRLFIVKQLEFLRFFIFKIKIVSPIYTLSRGPHWPYTLRNVNISLTFQIIPSENTLPRNSRNLTQSYSPLPAPVRLDPSAPQLPPPHSRSPVKLFFFGVLPHSHSSLLLPFLF